MQRSVKITLVILFSLTVGGYLLFHGLALLGERIGGHHYNLSNSEDTAKLRNFAASAQSLIVALERYKVDKGQYPDDVSQLSADYLNPPPNAATGMWKGFVYIPEPPTGYSFYFKLNWDASLRYYHQVKGRNRWCYDPGDGPEESHLPIVF